MHNIPHLYCHVNSWEWISSRIVGLRNVLIWRLLIHTADGRGTNQFLFSAEEGKVLFPAPLALSFFHYFLSWDIMRPLSWLGLEHKMSTLKKKITKPERINLNKCTHTHINTHSHTYVYTHIRIYMHISTHTHVYTYTHPLKLCALTHIHTRVYINILICVHMNIYIHVYTYIQIHMYTYMYAHVHT